MLLANNLSFERDNKTIFKELDISLSPKKIIHLYGHNGVGKTTLIKILANVLNSNTGEIYWHGKNIKKNIYEYFSDLTYIMDSHTSNDQMTIIENIRYWMKLFSAKIKLSELDSILEMLLLENKKNKKVAYLSRGEIKKLELVRLVIEKKKFWLLDEPYSGLDDDSIILINETFKNHLNNNGMIIFASHYRPEIQNIEIINLQKYANH